MVVLTLALAASILLAACSGLMPVKEPQQDDWVVVTFDDTVQVMPAHLMDALLNTELAADEALEDAGAGAIDGNEIGNHTYDLYFVGQDRNEMWKVLEPIFAEAPVPWTKVELRDGLEDPSPTTMMTIP